MLKKNKIDAYLSKKTEWESELNLIRALLHESELTEDFKWGVPIYTLNGKNVIGMAAFKNYTGLWFFQGVFLTDEKGLLINAQEDKTKGLRQLRFKNVEEINPDLLKEYIAEAIQNQKDGKEIKIEKTKTVTIPLELKVVFRQQKELEKAFKNLSPGKQREYAEYIESAKRENTRLSRLEKIIPMIQQGVGLHDKYKNC